MNVHLLKNSPHLRGILSSKAVGEPPLLLSVSALSAVQVRLTWCTPHGDCNKQAMYMHVCMPMSGSLCVYLCSALVLAAQTAMRRRPTPHAVLPAYFSLLHDLTHTSARMHAMGPHA